MKWPLRKKAAKSQSRSAASDHSHRSESSESRATRSRAQRSGAPSRTGAPSSKRSTATTTSSRSRETREERRQHVREEAQRDAELGCCHGCLRFLVRLIHIIDVMAGLTLLIYGFLVSAEPNPPPGAVSSVVAYGSILLITSVMGVLGFLTGWCKRCGLVVSAYGGPMIGLLEITAVICIAVSKDSFFKYLRDNQKALLMNEQTISNLEKSIGVLYAIALLCAAVEILRYFMLSTLRENMLRYDDARRRAFASRRRNRRARITNEDLEEPLLTETAPPASSKKEKKSAKGSRAATSDRGTKKGRAKKEDVSEGERSLPLDPVDETLGTDELWWSQGEREEGKPDTSWARDHDSNV